MKLILAFLVVLFTSCSEEQKTNATDANKSVDCLRIHTPAVEHIESIEIKNNTGQEKFMDTLIFGKKWSEIEMSGDPDTALALFAYRIIYTDNKDESDDCLSLMNLLETTKSTKVLMKNIFKSRISVYDFDKALDSLNKASIMHAHEIVKEDIEQYGESEGPCFELYEKTK